MGISRSTATKYEATQHLSSSQPMTYVLKRPSTKRTTQAANSLPQDVPLLTHVKADLYKTIWVSGVILILVVFIWWRFH